MSDAEGEIAGPWESFLGHRKATFRAPERTGDLDATWLPVGWWFAVVGWPFFLATTATLSYALKANANHELAGYALLRQQQLLRFVVDLLEEKTSSQLGSRGTIATVSTVAAVTAVTAVTAARAVGNISANHLAGSLERVEATALQAVNQGAVTGASGIKVGTSVRDTGGNLLATLGDDVDTVLASINGEDQGHQQGHSKQESPHCKCRM
ncbi:hypothetical protein QOT17_014195 [Balamuthia mandrillaris]